MATLLDIGLIEVLIPLFVFLLVFALAMSVLLKTNLIENKTLAAVAAASIALLTTISMQMATLIRYIVPWFLLLLFVVFFMLAMFRFFGIEDKELWSIFGSIPIFVIILIIVLIGLSVVFEQVVSPYTPQEGPGGTVITPDTTTEFPNAEELKGTATNPRAEALRTITHPKILAALFMLIIAAGSIKFLVDKYK